MPVETRQGFAAIARSAMTLLAVMCLMVLAVMPALAAPSSVVPPPGNIVFGRMYRPSTDTFKYPQNAFRIGHTFGWLAHLRRAVHANQLAITIDVIANGAVQRHLGPVPAAPGNRALVSLIHSSLPGPDAVREGLNKPGTYVLRYSAGGATLATGTFRLNP